MTQYTVARWEIEVGGRLLVIEIAPSKPGAMRAFSRPRAPRQAVGTHRRRRVRYPTLRLAKIDFGSTIMYGRQALRGGEPDEHGPIYSAPQRGAFPASS